MTKLFGANPFREVKATLNEEVDRFNEDEQLHEEGLITPDSRERAAKAAHSPMVRYFSNSKRKAKLDNVAKGLFNRHDGIPRKPRDQSTARGKGYFDKGSYFGEGATVFGDNPFHTIKEGRVKSAMMDFHDEVANDHQSKVDMHKKLGGGSHHVIADYEHTPSGGLKMSSRIVHNDGSHTDIFTRGENGKIDHSISRGSRNDDMNEGFVNRVARRMTGTAGLIPKSAEKKAVVADRLNAALNKDVKDEKPYKLARTSKSGDPKRYPVDSMKKRSERAYAMRTAALGDEPEKDYTLGNSVSRLSHTIKKSNIEMDHSLQTMRYFGRGAKDTIKDITDKAEALRAQKKNNAAQKLADMQKEAKRAAGRRYRARMKLAKGKK